ncbi:YcnI family copper-binding membrane protein [Oharaeibacter diazotrophicus]|uniref:Uncharacterized protein YcnI n=1 Tax=Oharaeibacter diazotrophicus TaxID=1920512 RepID=A0A4R6R9A5_9HYPH|nr:DUF1775 domain-containing protein [Oharaeibacter diazotrophicus]TDP82640.1 uncharacterized protein YcnI [Oharaeibacter diazotrophicus]BBE72596.1 hypothetical protein OHA_1_02194 [Pleomorphomonas sp. SM30]GLS76629.1 nuclear export factor GLE1 [Oharaeibacter diazotrophicus]
MTTITRTLALAAVLAVGATGLAEAHATLEVKEAAAGSTYKAVVRVGHGCGGKATLKLRVQIPEGLYNVKPMPKAGWTLDLAKGAYAKAYDNHGTQLTEGVREITWTGDLPDAYYDEFVFRGTIDKTIAPGTVLYIPVVQECDGAAERWIEVPKDGQSADDLESPAPALTVTAPKGGH